VCAVRRLAKRSDELFELVPPSARRSLRVLVVDDDTFIQDLTREVLSDIGVAAVDCARDGIAALERIDAPATVPDVIICDIEMEGMDGIVLIRHLAQRRFSGAIILMSGSSERIVSAVADLVRRHDLRLLGILAKPIEPAVLARLLDAATVVGQRSVAPGPSNRAIALSTDEIRRGIGSGSVEIALQPKISLASMQVVGAEALLRWNDPVRGVVLPGSVVPIAEANGLIDELTLAVFRRAAESLERWRSEGLELSISVNLSVDNLARLDLPETLAQIAFAAGADPRRIVLEVTESRLMGHLATSIEVLGRLSLAGFRLSMDDFGTGYSSLEKLKQLPFDELKVDRAFVSGAANDPVARTILRSSVELGHALGLSVVAEGLETRADWEVLTALGCDEAQGYYFGRPMPLAAFADWVKRFDAGTVLAR